MINLSSILIFEDELISRPKTLKQFLEQHKEIMKVVTNPSKQQDLLDQWKYELTQRFPELGKGTNRYVFDIQGRYALKVVKRGGGSDQNRQEVLNFKCLGEEYAPKVFGYDKNNFYWILVEQVKRFEEEYDNVNFEMYKRLFQKLGIDHEEYWSDDSSWTFLYNTIQWPDFSKPFIKNLYQTNEWYRNLMNRLRDCHVHPGDLHANNWGYRSNDDLLILDAPEVGGIYGI